MKRPTLPLLPLPCLPDCTHPELQWVAPSIGHAGDLYRCTSRGGYTMRGKPNVVRS